MPIKLQGLWTEFKLKVKKKMGVGKRETCDGAVYNGAVFEFNRHCLVVQLHQKPAHFPFQIRKKKRTKLLREKEK